jgi:quercetin dioxygenase-like cupin family protein
MSVVDLRHIAVRELFPGLRARIVHTAGTSQSWVDVDDGASFPEHAHPHEQTVNVLEGTLDVTVSGVTHRLTPGTVLVIPPHAPHSGRALTACRVLDVFSPARDDYR